MDSVPWRADNWPGFKCPRMDVLEILFPCPLMSAFKEKVPSNVISGEVYQKERISSGISLALISPFHAACFSQEPVTQAFFDPPWEVRQMGSDFNKCLLNCCVDATVCRQVLCCGVINVVDCNVCVMRFGVILIDDKVDRVPSWLPTV